ncbi:hypothetical protein B1VFA_034 [Rhizobium phage B1VFA]|nr:hypothetical protein B1VFA_034 [Rhizobium phage B1VFA]
MPDTNVLDALFEAALEHEFFPKGTIMKRRFEGAHGPGATNDILFEDQKTGKVYRITAELQPTPVNAWRSVGA